MSFLEPDITDVSVPRHGVLVLTFEDGTTGEVEVIDRMWGPVFEEARTVEGFASVWVDPVAGSFDGLTGRNEAEGVGFEPTNALRRQQFSRLLG
jgi:hypothetical protein